MPDLEGKFADLHEKVLDELIRRVQDPEAKPADIANAIKFLQANNISSSPKASGSKIAELLRGLPDFAKEALDTGD